MPIRNEHIIRIHDPAFARGADLAWKRATARVNPVCVKAPIAIRVTKNEIVKTTISESMDIMSV